VAADLRLPLSNLTSADDMRRILLSAVKILVSAALLYFALRKINFYDLHRASTSRVWAGSAWRSP